MPGMTHSQLPLMPLTAALGTFSSKLDTRGEGLQTKILKQVEPSCYSRQSQRAGFRSRCDIRWRDPWRVHGLDQTLEIFARRHPDICMASVQLCERSDKVYKHRDLRPKTMPAGHLICLPLHSLFSSEALDTNACWQGIVTYAKLR
jgi:hypothetical protein